jgi:NADH dehydrogenase
MAGQIAEMARHTLRREYRSIDTRTARVLLVEGTPRVLPGFPEPLSASAERALIKLGVTPLVGHTVVDVGPGAVDIRDTGGSTQTVPARTAVWAAGVTASPLATTLAEAAGGTVDRAGRLQVGPDLTVPGHPELIALGDMVVVYDTDGQPLSLPGVAPVAIQQGRYAARLIAGRLRGRSQAPFRYRDKGNLATIGRSKAVADVKGLHLSGFVAWALWLGVHIVYLIGFENRFLVLVRWAISFFNRGRGARLITEWRSNRIPSRLS